MTKKVVLVDVEDRQALYINGRCVRQERRIALDDALSLIGVEFSKIPHHEALEEYAYECGMLPENMTEVKFVMETGPLE